MPESKICMLVTKPDRQLHYMQVTHKFILFYVRQYDPAAILKVYLPISDDWTILDMLNHAVRNFAHGSIEG